MLTPPKDNETVPAPQVIFSAILDPVFAVMGKPELFTDGLLFRTDNEVYKVIRFLGYHRCDPAFSPELLDTPVKGLSSVDKEEFAIAVLTEDEKALTRISGVGPKSAKRLILELRDKMKKVSETMTAGDYGKGGLAGRDAVSALVSLGFQERESADAVNIAARTLPAPTVQALIKAALAHLKER